MSHVRFVIAVCVSACLAGGLVLTQGPDYSNAVTIEIPGTKDGVVSLQTAGGWPLTIRMVANDPEGIGVYQYPDVYPASPQQGFIVFGDPDGCFSLASAPPLGCSSTLPPDETYLEFTPALNMPDLVKSRVDNVPAARLGEAPTLKGWTGTNGRNNKVFQIGPGVGASSRLPCDDSGSNEGCDNYGYGASPNVPGLVILSDTGVGLGWNPNSFRLTGVSRNLAGLMNSVTWTLNDCIGTDSDGCEYGRTSVTAHMNVPGVVPAAPYHALFTPVVRVDFNQPEEQFQFKDISYQIDGSDWMDHQDLTALSGLLDSWVTTLRVFVVSGRGPSTLADVNRDGKVDIQDARQAGYTLLSGETKVQFKTYHQEEAYLSGIPFDRNGDGMMYPPAPVGGGGVNPIPR